MKKKLYNEYLIKVKDKIIPWYVGEDLNRWWASCKTQKNGIYVKINCWRARVVKGCKSESAAIKKVIRSSNIGVTISSVSKIS